MKNIDSDLTLFDGGGAEKILGQISSAVTLGKAVAGGTKSDAANTVVDVFKSQRTEVKQVLAFELRLVQDLPELVVTTIATSDDPAVSVPFLEVSPSVTQDIILSIVDELNGYAQTAVARRPDVTDAIADALVDQGNQKVALTLARNDKVEISRDILERIVAKFPHDARILASANQAMSRVDGPAKTETHLPFNVLMSRSRAFAKNGMLNGEYLMKLVRSNALPEFEAALCVLSNINRKDVRKLVLNSADSLKSLEHACALAPGVLTDHLEDIKRCYAAVLTNAA
ncbi:MAG: DUF2336 domain-containing protein [Pseudomonadota bacterium]